MAGDPFAPNRVSVTLKHNGQFEDPWIVFEGSVTNVRSQIIDALGIEDSSELTLHALVVEADTMTKAAYNVGKELNGTPRGTGGRGWQRKPADSTPRKAAEPEKSEEEKLVERMVAEVETKTSIDDLQRYWAENRALFAEHTVLMDAYKAKGRALT